MTIQPIRNEWLKAATGIPFTYAGLLDFGARVINTERALNVQWGLKRAMDTLPPRFLTEPIPKGPAKGEIFDPVKLEEMLKEYYAMRGWDSESGLPIEERLKGLDMGDVATCLKKRGLLAPASARTPETVPLPTTFDFMTDCYVPPAQTGGKERRKGGH